MRRVLVALVVLAACSKRDEPTKEHVVASASAEPEAPGLYARAKKLHIVVERPGKAPTTLDKLTLEAKLPDVVGAYWVGWKLTTLVWEWNEKAAFLIIDEQDVTTAVAGMTPTTDASTNVTYLLVGKDGEERIARLVDTKLPPPPDAGAPHRLAKVLAP